MNAIVVRPLEKSDHADWRRLWTAYLEFYEATVPEEVYETTWRRLFDGGEFEPKGFLALVDGKRELKTCRVIGDHIDGEDRLVEARSHSDEPDDW